MVTGAWWTNHLQHIYTQTICRNPSKISQKRYQIKSWNFVEVVISLGFTAPHYCCHHCHHCHHCQHCHHCHHCHYCQLQFHSIQLAFVEATHTHTHTQTQHNTTRTDALKKQFPWDGSFFRSHHTTVTLSTGHHGQHCLCRCPLLSDSASGLNPQQVVNLCYRKVAIIRFGLIKLLGLGCTGNLMSPGLINGGRNLTLIWA
jgi:hypothetical protein